jgi:hypothetical protein
VSEHLVGEIGATGEREANRCELVKLDAPVRGRSPSVGAQPLDTSAPVATVEIDLTRETLDRVAAARLVSDPRREVDSPGDHVVCVGNSPALEEERCQPITCVNRQPGEDARLSFAIDAVAALERVGDPSHSSQRPGAREQRR